MNRALPFAGAALVVAADRASKIAVERSLSMWDSVPIIPGVVNLVYTRNRGAAFGLFNDWPDPWRSLLLIGVSGVILFFIARMLIVDGNSRWPLSLVLGGAIGNLYDRIMFGSVTDFIQVFLGSYEWPSFNVADSAISAGAVLLAVDVLRPKARAAGA
jgi:signal peptidase II